MPSKELLEVTTRLMHLISHHMWECLKDLKDQLSIMVSHFWFLKHYIEVSQELPKDTADKWIIVLWLETQSQLSFILLILIQLMFHLKKSNHIWTPNRRRYNVFMTEWREIILEKLHSQMTYKFQVYSSKIKTLPKWENHLLISSLKIIMKDLESTLKVIGIKQLRSSMFV